MSTLSDRSRDALARRQKQAAGVSITYTRTTGSILTLTAVPGLTTFRSAELPGRLEISARDYLLVVADLLDAGVAFLPAVGDRITETVNGVVKTFELQTPDSGEPAWRYCSQWRSMVRLHMKAV